MKKVNDIMRTLQTLKGCAIEGIITGLRGELNQVGRASSKDHAWMTCILKGKVWKQLVAAQD